MRILFPKAGFRVMFPRREEEVGTRSPFGVSVASDEPELAIDEGVPEISVVPNLQFFPDSNVPAPRRRRVREESVGGDRSKRQLN